MTPNLTRMWINQPSTYDKLHAMHGTNVLAEHEHGNTMRIFFMSGDVISMQVNRNALSEGWLPAPQRAEVLEVVSGLHAALSRMIQAHNPDSIEAEWLSHSNELIYKLTGRDAHSYLQRGARDNFAESAEPPDDSPSAERL